MRKAYLLGGGDLTRAAQLFEQVERNPNLYASIPTDYCCEIGRTNQARHCFREALKHDPNFGAAMNNLGSVLKDVARYDEALIWLRKGAEALKDNPAAHSNVLFTLVGYEFEPPNERLAEAQRFAERFCKNPLNVGVIESQIQTRKTVECWQVSPISPPCSELAHRATFGAMGPKN